MTNSDENFYYSTNNDGYLIGNQTDIPTNGLKKLDLVDCVIPSFFKGKNVYGFGYRCFYGAQNITRVYIPKTVTVFQGDTFVFCKKLEEIHFEEGFKNANLSYYTFYGSGIKSFRFPIGSTLWYDLFSYSEIRNVYIYDMTVVNRNSSKVTPQKS